MHAYVRAMQCRPTCTIDRSACMMHTPAEREHSASGRLWSVDMLCIVACIDKLVRVNARVHMHVVEAAFAMHELTPLEETGELRC